MIYTARTLLYTDLNLMLDTNERFVPLELSLGVHCLTSTSYQRQYFSSPISCLPATILLHTNVEAFLDHSGTSL